MPLFVVENLLQRCLILHCDCKCDFPSLKHLLNEHLLVMFSKMMDRYIAKCATTIASSNLWMSKFGCDTFRLIINFIDDQWVPCHVIIAFLETIDTLGATLAIQVNSLLVKFILTNKIITYAKDEGRIQIL